MTNNNTNDTIELNLTELINEKVDSISGRSFGQGYAKKVKLLEVIESGKKVKIIIPDSIKAINDSFIKGFFSEVFKKYKTKSRVLTFFEFETNVFYQALIDKNFTILDSIYNA